MSTRKCICQVQISPKKHSEPTYLLPLAAVLQDARCVVNGPVVFADRQVGALVLVHLNHQVVVLQLQLLHRSHTVEEISV